MAEKIFIDSFKGGTGVTTFCIGLGNALAESGERTLIVDGDVYGACGMLLGGMSNMQVYTLCDYERGACRAKQTIVEHRKNSNLYFMSSLGARNLIVANSAVAEVEGLFDYIILDKIAAESCKRGLIVTEPYLPSLKSADSCRSVLSDAGIEDIGLVVSKMNTGLYLNGEIMSPREIAKVLHLPLKAVIQEDLTLCTGNCKNSTRKAFKEAADVIKNGSEWSLKPAGGYSGFNGFIKRKMRAKI